MEKTETAGLSRRSFLKGAAFAGLAGLGASSFVGCTTSDGAEKADYLPESWDVETDIIVVGYGGAGAAAAITAAMEELGACIVLEAGQEGEEGGNSRVCGQNMLIPQDIDQAVLYQKTLNGDYVISEDPAEEEALYLSWATGLHENKEWLENLGATVTETSMNSHEFPEVKGNELGGTCYLIDNTVGQEALWKVLKEQEEYLGIEVHYGTRALKLVRNPLTNEALGVEAEKDGKTVFYKANKGVLLSCGGFENNMELVRTYCTIGSMWEGFYGTPYNRGDGFAMIAPFGAKLRNMNSTTGPNWAYAVCGEDSPVSWRGAFATKDYIFVGPNAKRFNNEEIYSTTRHGKFNINGVYQAYDYNTPSYTVFGQKCFDAGDIFTKSNMGWASLVAEYAAEGNQGFLDAGIIKKADTVEELAELIGYDPADLAETVARYNDYAAAGYDPDFHRGEPIVESMALLSALGHDSDSVESAEEVASEGFSLEPIEGPFYAVRMRSCMGANTQGGPKRDANGQVVDVENNPIPRLFSAGEFGSIYAYQYNGGGNVSDAIASGRLAARSIGALEPWDAE